MFSSATPLDVFGDLVLGRDGIDNYLLTRMDACGGVLLDASFACRREKRGETKWARCTREWRRVSARCGSE